MGVLRAHDLRDRGKVGRIRVDSADQAVALEEAVVALRADGDPWLQVQRGDDRRLAGHERLRPLADQEAGVEVIGCEQRIDCALRIGRRVQGDDHHSLVSRLLDARHDRFGVARGDEDALGARVDHVLERGHLAFVVAVLGTSAGHQLDAELGRFGLGAFLHLHEERVGIRLRDQAHDDLAAGSGRRRAGRCARRPAATACGSDQAEDEQRDDSLVGHRIPTPPKNTLR